MSPAPPDVFDPMKLSARTPLTPEKRDEIANAVGALRMLEELIRWGTRQTPARTITDVVVQDEYTHDVVMPYDDALFLVFDST